MGTNFRVHFFSTLILASALIFLFQNCGNIHLNPNSESLLSSACEDTLKSSPFNINFDSSLNPDKVTFSVSELLTDQSLVKSFRNYQWSINALSSLPAGDQLTMNIADFKFCENTEVRAKYLDCDGEHELKINYMRRNSSCVYVPPVPTPDPVAVSDGRTCSPNIGVPSDMQLLSVDRELSISDPRSWSDFRNMYHEEGQNFRLKVRIKPGDSTKDFKILALIMGGAEDISVGMRTTITLSKDCEEFDSAKSQMIMNDQAQAGEVFQLRTSDDLRKDNLTTDPPVTFTSPGLWYINFKINYCPPGHPHSWAGHNICQWSLFYRPARN